MITPVEDKIHEYYTTGEYKGFYEVIEHEGGNITHLTLTDGEYEVSASGIFRSEALSRIFDKIDRYRSH